MRTGQAFLALAIFLAFHLAVVGQALPKDLPKDSPRGPEQGPSESIPPKPQPAEKSPATITLTGKLTNANGGPISNASVTVALWDLLPQAITDNQGLFLFDELYAKLTNHARKPISGAKVTLLPLKAQVLDTNPQGIFRIKGLSGIIKKPGGEAIPEATVAVAPPIVRTGITDKDGKFTIEAVKPGPADITFHAYGFDDLIERGVPLSGHLTLNRTLREKSTGWWLLVLFVPAILGMFVSAYIRSREAKSGKTVNRFWMAGIYGAFWFVALLIPLLISGITKYEFLYPSLNFEFYVPLLGFLGALLYVLDLSRKGLEEINKEEEFQQRIILGPYVAIVMVVLFGKDLGIVDITSPIGRAAIAFLSGLLVVAVFQRIVEKGQEMLGEWRERSASYYVQSEIAKTFNLSREEDLKLRKGGIRYLSQLDEYKEDKLIEKVKEAGFDVTLAVALKKELAKKRIHLEIMKDFNIGAQESEKLQQAGVYNLIQLRDLDDNELKEMAQKVNFNETLIITLKKEYDKRQLQYEKPREEEKCRLQAAIGNMVWARLESLNVKTIEDFSHLSDKALDEVGKDQPEIDKEDLKQLRDKAKKFGLMQ
jgi:hypothetical protein